MTTDAQEGRLSFKNQSKSALELARDELFSHIHRCGVLQADEDQQVEWMDDTVDYLGGRFVDLTEQEMAELKTIGLRFCSPVIKHGAEHTALEDELVGEPVEGELAGEEVPAGV
jgi:hypothetical protein